jgi:hypothetical protein
MVGLINLRLLTDFFNKISIATDVARVKNHRCPLRSESNGPPSKRNLSQRANCRYSIWESGQLRLETQPTGDNFERFTGHVQVIHRGSLIFIAARHSAGDHFIGP